ncbi:MAG: DUF6923 family protein, partial [Rhodoglobus sp.]
AFDPSVPYVFVSQDAPTGLNRAIADINGNVSFAPEGPVSGITYNAIGYDTVTNYLYGVVFTGSGATPTNSIIRIGQNGVITRVGTSTLSSGSWVWGAVHNGFLYAGSAFNSNFAKIDLTTGTPTYQSLPSNPFTVDLAFKDGYFWSFKGDRIVRVDLLAPTPTHTSFPMPTPAGTFGAAWSLGNGNLAFSNNSSGDIYQVTITNAASATPTITLVSVTPGPDSGNNDGASSPGVPTDLSIVKTANTATFTAGDSLTYSVTVTNEGPGASSGSVISDVLPASLSNVRNLTPGCSVASNKITCTVGALAVGASATVTYTATTASTTPQTVVNAAKVLGNELDPTPNNSSTSFTASTEAGMVASPVSGVGVVNSPVVASVPVVTGVVSPPVFFALATLPPAAEGTAVIDPDTGVVTFTPAPGVSGRSVFSYGASTPAATVTATVTIDVVPVVVPLVGSTSVGVPVDVPLAPGATGTGLVFEVEQPVAAEGSVVVTAAGVATFTPAPGFSGVTTFRYRVTDADSLVSSWATVTVTVVPDTTDVAASGTLDAAGAAVVVAPAPVAAGTGPFTYAVTQGPSQGSAVIDPVTGVVTYTAATGVSGVFTVRYTVTDAAGGTSIEHVATFTVAPFASGVTATTPVDTPVDLPAPTATGTGPFTWAIVTPPAHGTATIDPATGVVSYTPDPGYSGNDVVQIQATDAAGAASGVVDGTIRVTPVVADVADSTVASATPPGVTIPLDGTGTGLVYQLTSAVDPARGTAVVSGGSVVITPAPGVSGIITVDYVAVDADGNASGTATVTLTIAPVAVDAAVTIASGETGTVAVPAPLGTGPMTFTLTSPVPAGLSAASIDPVTGLVTVTGAPGFSGVVTLTYTVTDADGITSTPKTITVTVTPSVPPLAQTISASVSGQPPSIASAVPAPLGSGPFTFALGTPPPASAGVAVIDPVTGVIIFTAAVGFSGVVDIPLTATDATGAVIPGVFRVTVIPAIPIAAAGGAQSGDFGATQLFTPPVPVGVGPFTFELATLPDPSKGRASIDPLTGVITFIPAAGFTGVVDLSFVVVDSTGLRSAPAVVTFTVRPPAGGLAATGLDTASGLIAGGGVLIMGITMVWFVRRRSRESH